VKHVLLIILLLTLAFIGCKKQDAQPAETAQADPNMLVQTEYAQDAEPEQDASTQVYTPGEWITDAGMAMAFAREMNRPILMNFTGSDWCPWCFKLRDEVFAESAFKKYAAENLVLLTVDFPRKKQLPKSEQQANDALAEKYGVEGFPTIVLTDGNGKEINRTGYQPGGAAAYVTHLKALLAKK